MQPSETRILASCREVAEQADQVTIRPEAIQEVTSWMAYEELPWPRYWSTLTPDGSHGEIADFLFLTASMNFAFTDFRSREIFRTEYRGQEYADADAMTLCWRRALEEGTPVLDGSYLAEMTAEELSSIFAGNIPVPMLGQRVEILREIGSKLCSAAGGRFHRWLQSCPLRLYANGEGLLEQFVATFKSFDDRTTYRDNPVFFWKRAQLLCWQLLVRFKGTGFFELEDPERLTFFADYIVPMALHLHGILQYSPELEERISRGGLLQAGEEAEVELRAATIWAGHLLTREVNRLRPADRQVIEPVLDARFWTHFHDTHYAHHLVETTAY